MCVYTDFLSIGKPTTVCLYRFEFDFSIDSTVCVYIFELDFAIGSTVCVYRFEFEITFISIKFWTSSMSKNRSLGQIEGTFC